MGRSLEEIRCEFLEFFLTEVFRTAFWVFLVGRCGNVCEMSLFREVRRDRVFRIFVGSWLRRRLCLGWIRILDFR